MDFNPGVYLHFPKILMRFVGFIPHDYWYTMIYHPKSIKKQKLPVQRSVFFPFPPPCAEFQAPPPFNSAHGCLKFACHRALGLWSKNHWKTHQLWRLSPTWLAILLGLGSWKICSKPLYSRLEVVKVITKVASSSWAMQLDHALPVEVSTRAALHRGAAERQQTFFISAVDI